MNFGKIVESAPAEALFASPRHPYTRALLSAIPALTPHARRERVILQADLPNVLEAPEGCRFHTRCPHVIARCRSERPALIADASGHATACHRVGELPAAGAATGGSFSPALDRLIAAFTKRAGDRTSGERAVLE